MHYVLLVQKLECKKCLPDNLNRLFLSEGFVTQCFIKVFSFKHFLNYEEILPVLEDVIHLDDVWMIRIHQNFELIH